MRPSTLSSVAALAAHAMAAPQLLPVGHLSSIMATATSAFVDPKAELSTSTVFGPAPTAEELSTSTLFGSAPTPISSSKPHLIFGHVGTSAITLTWMRSSSVSTPAPTEDIVTVFHEGRLVTTEIYTETEAAVAKWTPRDVAPSVITPAPTLPIVLGQKFARSVKTVSTNTPVIAGGEPKASKIPVAPDMAIVPGTTPRTFHCKVEGCFYDDDGSSVAKMARDVNVNERMAASTQTVVVVPTDATSADAAPEDEDDEEEDTVLKAHMATRTRAVTAGDKGPAFSSFLPSLNAAIPTPFEGHPPQ